MVQALRDGFGDQLISVVVYGSHARGTAKPGSDVDLLVVVRELPRDWRAIHRLEDEWARHGRRFGRRFQVMLATPQDVEDSVECAAPLMLEIHANYKIILDHSGSFGESMVYMGRLMRERGIQLRRPGVWEVPEHAVSS
jgi:predicted nucleotidyltransferase